MVLTGEGSDEVLGGYPKHQFEHSVVPHYRRIPKAVRRNLLEPLLAALAGRSGRATTAASCLAIDDPAIRFPRWFGALLPRESGTLLREAYTRGKHARDDTPFQTDSHDSPLRKILYFDQTSWLPDNLLERGDRMTMAASIEARMPFMDHILVEFVSSLPDRYRIRRGSGKWLLKRAMEGILPGSILKRPKVGFRMPIAEWFRGAMSDFLRDSLIGPGSTTAIYYDRGGLEDLLDEHASGRRDHSKLLWALLNLEILQRHYARH
jgi:asparagine synthase (glutamine-hydrolysing)